MGGGGGLSNSSKPAEPPLDPPLHALAENSLAWLMSMGIGNLLHRALLKSFLRLKVLDM